MTDTDAIISELRGRVRTLELDRDYWRGQHDLVMQDWRSDLEAWSAARDDFAARERERDAALAALLRFYDPETGAVAARRGHAFLSDAFATAKRLQGLEQSAASSTEGDFGQKSVSREPVSPESVSRASGR